MSENNIQNLTVDNISDSEEFSAIIKFLEQTKDGKYAEIEKTSLDYSRLNIDSETIDNEENYFYSIS